jgi:hypothetical protein
MPDSSIPHASFLLAPLKTGLADTIDDSLIPIAKQIEENCRGGNAFDEYHENICRTGR